MGLKVSAMYPLNQLIIVHHTMTINSLQAEQMDQLEVFSVSDSH